MPDPRPPAWLVVAIAALALLALARSDQIRTRAEAALGAGMPAREAALARGFVLGQDEEVDSRTVEDFRRSGLAHLMAVSGQNVALLALLAMPLLAAAGIGLRFRLVWVLALIAAYVPLAGAGPTILRAALMGGISILAMLAGRRSSRLYALGVAAGLTLAVEPAFGRDVGWQLSFAAVLGIILIAAPLRALLGAGAGGLRTPLRDGAAMTIAATLATAPLLSFHFGTVSVVSLAANLLALPAIAPAMWLGMLAAGLGQIPAAPVALVNDLNAPLLAYIAEVASFTARPGWAQLELRLGGTGLAVAYLAVGGLALVINLGSRRLAAQRSGRGRGARRPKALPRPLIAVPVLLLIILVTWGRTPGVGGLAPPAGLRISVLDIGQGDAILLEPGRAAPILVDTGPDGLLLVERLAEAGIERLGAVLVTHDQADHSGGLDVLLEALPVAALGHAVTTPATLAIAARHGVRTRPLAAGEAVTSGRLRLEVIWPPAEVAAAGPPDDPNALSLVAIARWGRFRMLLTGDAEAGVVPLDPGRLDVLKVAHHGSEDPGLAALLERTRPGLAVISVGAGNPFGHPTKRTSRALAESGARVLRTDLAGTVVIEVAGGAVTVGSRP